MKPVRASNRDDSARENPNQAPKPAVNQISPRPSTSRRARYPPTTLIEKPAIKNPMAAPALISNSPFVAATDSPAANSAHVHSLGSHPAMLSIKFNRKI